MKTMKQKDKENRDNFLSTYIKIFKENIQALIVFICWFIVLLIIVFTKVSTEGTVSAVAVSDYEVGQIADRTIIANKTVLATNTNEISVIKGEKLSKKGFPITEEDFSKLNLLSKTPQYIDARAFANSVLYMLLLGAFIFFIFSSSFIGRKIKINELVFLAAVSLLVYGIGCFASRINAFSSAFSLPVIIPATLVVILITIIFGQISATYFSFIIFFALLQATSFNTIPAIFELCSCLASIRIVRKIEKRIDLVVSSLFIAVLNAVFLFLLKIILNSDESRTVFDILGVAFNGFLSGILALGFTTPLETLMNTASVFRLMDLSDLNSPIMRRMLLVAPGTYNHSMMVATLAESACSEIGANPLLARVGAYYHDLGKIESPEYFVENQTGENKHIEMNNPRLSASVIRSHVKKGVEKAHQMRLPEEVIDIISQHHGNSLISYFYSEAKKTDEQVSPEEYSYIGTPPTSKEAAVVMLADTVEAACRTLEKPSVSRLEKFIHQLIMTKYEHRQLDKANITFKELDIIQNVFVTILAGYYHTRIEYPDQKDPDANTTEKSIGTEKQ